MLLDNRKNPKRFLNSLFMVECAVKVEAETKTASEENSEMPPVFSHTNPQPVIERHGLW